MSVDDPASQPSKPSSRLLNSFKHTPLPHVILLGWGYQKTWPKTQDPRPSFFGQDILFFLLEETDPSASVVVLAAVHPKARAGVTFILQPISSRQHPATVTCIVVIVQGSVVAMRSKCGVVRWACLSSL